MTELFRISDWVGTSRLSRWKTDWVGIYRLSRWILTESGFLHSRKKNLFYYGTKISRSEEKKIWAKHYESFVRPRVFHARPNKLSRAFLTKNLRWVQGSPFSSNQCSKKLKKSRARASGEQRFSILSFASEWRAASLNFEFRERVTRVLVARSLATHSQLFPKPKKTPFRTLNCSQKGFF